MSHLFRSLLLAIIAISLSIPWISANAEPVKPKSDSRIDLKSSRVYILVDKKGLGHQHGIEGRIKSGALTLGASRDAGEIVFDMTSFEADTDNARKHVGLKGQTDVDTQKKVSENMLGPKVLDVENHPTAAFKIDSATAMGERSKSDHPLYELRGSFTLHGTTRPLTFVAEAIESKESTRIRGQFNIIQTDYGMKPFSMGFGTVGVADELQIWGEIDLQPQLEKTSKTP